MDKYTYKDVIIDPNDPRVEIGAEYWFSDCPNGMIKELNRGEELKHGVLLIVNHDESYPFEDEDYNCWTCIIRKKESTYEERQAEWVKEHNLKAGDKVKILKGFKCGFVAEMEESIGKTLTIKEVKKNGIDIFNEDKSDFWLWPYYCLEKVKEPEFQVGDLVKDKDGNIGIINDFFKDNGRMFAMVRYNDLHSRSNRLNDLAKIKAHLEPFPLYEEETRALLRGRYVQYEANGFEPIESPILTFHLCDGAWAIVLPVIGYLNSQNFLDKCKFLNGTPCGKLVEDEE